VSGKQQLAAETELSAAGLYSTRAFASNGVAVTADGAPPGIEAARGTVSQAVATASLGAPLFRDWSGTAALNYSSTHQRRYGTALPSDLTASNTTDSLSADFQLASVDLSVTGELFRLPGGMARLSAGLATRYETYKGTVPSVVPLPTISQSRAVRSVYGEASFPLVDHSAGLRWAQAVDVSLAYRFDDYTDIGSAAKPKFGWSWVPIQGYKLKGTFGESFEAPLLSQMYSPVTSYTTTLPSQPVPLDTLVVEGGSRGLSPEKSMSVTVGAEIEPAVLRGFKTSVSYFYVKFRDRIQSQNIEAKSLLLQPLLIAHSGYIDNPSEILSFYDIPGFQRDNAGLGPSGVALMVDNRLVNSESTTMAGLTLDNRYRYSLPAGFVDLFASALFILSDQTQSIAWVPSVDVSGTVGEPPKWKIAAGADWESTTFGLEFRVNSISGAQNVLASPYQSVSSFTTADMAFHYDWPDEDKLLLRGVTLGLSVQNIFDRHPPLIQIPTEDAAIGRPTIPYDGTNASAVGRFIELSIKKRW
jgi:outer membrane receptor protein involved in Fe transport